MGRRKKYRDPKPKVRRPKNHAIDEDEMGTFYRRSGQLPKRVIKETPYRLKMRNLLALQVEMWGTLSEPNAEKFCIERNISMSNYRRLIAIIKAACDDYDGYGNTVPDTATTRKYLLVIKLHEALCNGGVEREEFCKRNNISRVTFFRYLSDIDDYVMHETRASWLTINADTGDYYIFPPYD